MNATELRKKIQLHVSGLSISALVETNNFIFNESLTVDSIGEDSFKYIYEPKCGICTNVLGPVVDELISDGYHFEKILHSEYESEKPVGIPTIIKNEKTTIPMMNITSGFNVITLDSSKIDFNSKKDWMKFVLARY